MYLQSVECAEKVIKKLPILYRNARNLLKSTRHDKLAQVKFSLHVIYAL